MEAYARRGMSFKNFDEWQITTCIGLFKNVVEIAARLVGVDQEDQMELLWHEDWIGLLNTA